MRTMAANSAELVALSRTYSRRGQHQHARPRSGAATSIFAASFGKGIIRYIDGLIGYRFLELTDSLTISESSSRLTPVAPNPADPSSLIVSGAAFDRFRTVNQFNGGQFGTAMGCRGGRWVFDVRAIWSRLAKPGQPSMLTGANRSCSPMARGLSLPAACSPSTATSATTTTNTLRLCPR